MGKRTYKLMKTLRNEQAQIAKAAKKRGLWSSLGSALLGGVAMLVTGGAASPVVAGLFAGGARALGGHLGNYLAGQSEGGKIKGGRFFQGQRASLAQNIKDKINTGAVKTAFKVGGINLLGKLGGKLKIGSKGEISGELDFSKAAKETLTGTATEAGKAATTDGGFLGKLFERGDAAPGKYGTTQKGFKGLIDYEGSPLGKFFEEGRKSKILTAQRSRVATDIPEFTQQMPISETDIVGEFGAFGKPGQEYYKSQAEQLDPMKDISLRGRPESDLSGVLKQQNIGEMQYKTPTAKGFAQRLLPGGESGYQTDVPLGKGLDKGERIAYDKINKMTEAGYPPVHPMDRTKTGYYSLPEEFGEGFIDTKTGETVRPPGRPDVEMPSLKEDIDFGKDIIIEDTEMAGFDEALWKKGEEQLRSWDFQRDVGFAKEHPGLYPDQNLMDGLGKPSLDIPLEVTPKVGGRGGVDHEKFYAGVSPEELRRGPIVQARSTMEQIDLPRKSPLLTGQNIKTQTKRAIEGIFSPPEIFETRDKLRTPGYGYQGPPEKLGMESIKHAGEGMKPPQWWNNLFGEKR